MKIFSILFLLILFSAAAFSQDDTYKTDPQVKYYRPYVTTGADHNYLDNILFVNNNLTVNTAPQNEPSVRISRINSNIVVAAWRDFRLGYTNPVIRRIGYSYSTNGGLTWAAPQLLPDPMPGHATQSDPVLMSDNNGIFYIATTSREATNVRGETVVYRSTNNGVNWLKYSVAAASSSFEDKEWITCDLVPGSPNFNNLYITWTRIGSGIRFVKSSNGGLNWTTPVNVGDNSAGQGSNVAVGTNYYIYVVWGESAGIKFDKSTNGGTSFGTDYQLSNVVGNVKGSFPFISVDYSNHATRGNVYVVWADNRGGNDDVWFNRSTNAGANWLTNPVRVNDVQTGHQYKPAIACDTNGNIGVIYYDERTGAGIVNSWYAFSTNQGTTWNNQRVSDSSFTYISIGSEVRNGEYIGIDAYQNKVITVWCDDRKGTPNQEIYTANLNYVVSVQNNGEPVPSSYALLQNYPNPFNPETVIEYYLPKKAYVTLKIHDINGRIVKTLVTGEKGAGKQGEKFNSSALSSGVYFYTITAVDISGDAGQMFTDTKKMILIK
ncbi:MAG: T9SS C-terminal target domain-containing protein [Ignavibacteriae bacterium]|nr:MAG: T9SS C-terminal target domain-containing protein [Ignavibacteriota bacterium]